jgi:hypothetical protein
VRAGRSFGNRPDPFEIHDLSQKHKKWAPAHFSCLQPRTRSSLVYHAGPT